MVKIEINLDKILRGKNLKLWKKEYLQEEIDKIDAAQKSMREKLTPEQIIGYLLVIEHTETCCSNTPCKNCGLNYVLEYLEGLKKSENRRLN